MRQETIFALTSLSPAPDRVSAQGPCIQSWRNAGLQVRSFNHSAEISRLASLFQVDFVPVENASANPSGRRYVPINAMLDWAAAQDAPALIVNSDIELQLSPWELKRVRWLSDGGLCYFVRHNHDGLKARASREPHGIDAFLLHGRDAPLFPRSSLSMGQPFWDYWIPYTMAASHRPICSAEFPAAFHRNHSRQWAWDHWYRCAMEFDRLTGELQGERSQEACIAMSNRVRQIFDRERSQLSPRPIEIQKWVQHTFCNREPKTFLELGAHCGTDTVWMAAIPGVTLYAFEPDPRNHPPSLPNVKLYRAAIGDRDGSAPFLLSKDGWGREWTYSSSIKSPKNHLTRYPVSFGETIEVNTITLDSFCQQQGLGAIDFIWADIQGAEGEMIRGGRQTLERSHYLFTEYSDDELYENQATLRDMLDLLPDFHVIELWPDDVLLENRRFCGSKS